MYEMQELSMIVAIIYAGTDCTDIKCVNCGQSDTVLTYQMPHLWKDVLDMRCINYEHNANMKCRNYGHGAEVRYRNYGHSAEVRCRNYGHGADVRCRNYGHACC